MGTYASYSYYDAIADVSYLAGTTGMGMFTLQTVNNAQGAVSFYWRDPLNSFFEENRIIGINEYDDDNHLLVTTEYKVEPASDEQIRIASKSSGIQSFTANDRYEIQMGYINENTGFISTDEGSFVFDTSSYRYKYVYEYDKNSNCVSQKTYREGNLTSRTDREFDRLNNCTREQEFTDEVLVSEFEREYDKDGKLIQEETRKYASGNLLNRNRFIYEYDKNGGQIRMTHYNIGSSDWTITTELRDGKKDIRYVSHYTNGILDKYTISKYLYEFVLSEKMNTKIANVGADCGMCELLENTGIENILLEADEYGMLISIKVIDDSGKVIRESTGKWYDNPDSGEEKTMYYMLDGDKVMYVYNVANGWKTTTVGEYQYDENGNPISGTITTESYFDNDKEVFTATASYVKKDEVFNR